MNDQIKAIVTAILDSTPFKVESLDIESDEKTGMIWCRINSSDSQMMIGRNGETLDAINHLVRRLFERTLPADAPHTISVLVDVNNYQKKRVEHIQTKAHMMAERARYFKSVVEVDPMSAFERKIVHEFLANASDVKTESTGTGPNRRVTIKYVENKI